jgi:hypothetical protein
MKIYHRIGICQAEAMEGVQQECSTFIATVRRMDPKGTIFDGGWEEDSRRRRCERGHDVGKPYRPC